MAHLSRVGVAPSPTAESDRVQALSDMWDRLRTAVYGRGARPLATAFAGLSVSERAVTLAAFDKNYELAKAYTKQLMHPPGDSQKWAALANAYAAKLKVPQLQLPGVLDQLAANMGSTKEKLILGAVAVGIVYLVLRR